MHGIFITTTEIRYVRIIVIDKTTIPKLGHIWTDLALHLTQNLLLVLHLLTIII